MIYDDIKPGYAKERKKAAKAKANKN